MSKQTKIIMDDYDAGYSDGYNIGYVAGLIAYAEKKEAGKPKKCCGGGCHTKTDAKKVKAKKSNKK